MLVVVFVGLVLVDVEFLIVLDIVKEHQIVVAAIIMQSNKANVDTRLVRFLKIKNKNKKGSR